MKKWLLILLVMVGGNVYAYDVTKGALQNDPALCSYGYNHNCSSRYSYSAPPPPDVYFAVIATNLETGRWGWSTGYTNLDVAKRDAIRNCKGENGEFGPCDWRVYNANGCLAVVVTQNKNKTSTYYASQSGICGQTEQEAMQICKANKGKNCKVDIPEINAKHLYWLYQ